MIRIHFHMFVYTQTLEMWNPPYSGWLGDGTAITCRKCSLVADLIYPWISYIWFILCTHMGCLSDHIPQLHSSGVTSASCSSPDHKLIPSSSKHSPKSSYISNFHLLKCPLVLVCLLVNFFIECPCTHKPLASFAGQVPGFIVHGTSLHRSSPAITDNASYSDTFQLGINIDGADFP